MDTVKIDTYTLIATITIAVIGWLISVWLQGRSIKRQYKIQIQYDIYKQFVHAHKDIQEALSKLGAIINPPFNLMESSMIPFDLKLKKQYKDIFLPYSEIECVFEGEKKWTSYVQKINDIYSEFGNNYISFIYIFEDWMAALGSLLPKMEVLFQEIETNKLIISEQISALQMYSVNHGNDWRKWDKEDVKKIIDIMHDSIFNMIFYVQDFMVIVHNELLAKYFKQKRPTRKTLDPKYKVLTTEGIVENLDNERIAQMKIFKTKLVTVAQTSLDNALPPKGTITPEYEKFLRSIINGICPTCNNRIEVMSMEESEHNFSFRFICGHSWKGIILKETANIRELLILKIAREGFGKVRKIVMGWKSSGDPKLNQGVDVFMDANREKNEYHHIVNDHQTKEILHEEHEPLTEHK